MNQQAMMVQRPRTTDSKMWDIVEGYCCYQTFFVAHDLKLFSVLANKALTISQIGQALNIEQRPAEVILSACASLGLIQVQEGQYSLTPVAEDYLVESSPTYFGGFIDFAMIQNRAINAFESVKQAVLTNKPQVYGGQEVFKTHEEQVALARAFTQFMHSQSVAAGLSWSNYVDLSQSKTLLDIGGGSGIFSIGAVQRWSNLQATVLDIPPVCMVANEYIAQYGLQDRIATQAADMWNTPFPAADIHLYSNIFHDWIPDKCRFLAQKSFDSLEPGGRIIIHEMLMNDDKTGPVAAAGINITMLLCTEGQQYSGVEFSEMLTNAGFTNIEVKAASGYWGIVTGYKPK
jgi:predicted nicotinamide N-methyase